MEIYQLSNKGLSLIEVLVAVGVVSVLLVSMVAALTKSMASARVSKNRSLASSYLQEGVEYARQCRDQADGWEDFVGEDFSGASAVPFPFSRIFTMSNLSPPDSNKRKVTVNVEWADSKGTHNVASSTILSNW